MSGAGLKNRLMPWNVS